MEINVLIDGEFEECPEVNWLQGVAEQVLVAQGTSPDAVSYTHLTLPTN